MVYVDGSFDFLIEITWNILKVINIMETLLEKIDEEEIFESFSEIISVNLGKNCAEILEKSFKKYRKHFSHT